MELDPDRVIMSWLLNRVAQDIGTKAVIKGISGAAWTIASKNGASKDEASAAAHEARTMAGDLLHSKLEVFDADEVY